MAEMVCRARTKASASCRAPSLPGRETCLSHTGELADKIAAARRAGGSAAAKVRLLQGRRIRLEHQGQLAKFLSALAQDCLAGTVAPDVTRAVVYTCATLRQVVETGDLAARLEALEQQLAPAGGLKRGGRRW
jgi:hypothetical protein